MFPTAPRLVSKAADADQRADIELILNAVIEANGGVELWQDAALLSSIYGFVDFMVTCRGLERAARRRDAGASGAVPSKPDMRERAHEFASQIAIETVEAPRAIPVLSRSDYRRLDAYILHFEQPTNDVASRGASARFAQRILGGGAKPRRKTITVTEIHSDRFSQRYEDGRLVEQRSNELGRLAGGAHPELEPAVFLRRRERRGGADSAAGRIEHALERPREPRDDAEFPDVAGQGRRRIHRAAGRAGADVDDGEPRRVDRIVRRRCGQPERTRAHRGAARGDGQGLGGDAGGGGSCPGAGGEPHLGKRVAG